MNSQFMVQWHFSVKRIVLLLLTCVVLHARPELRSRIGRVAVDYGPRTIGIAHGNYLGVVQPFGTIRNSGSLSSIARKVADLAKTWSASEIIVGVPLDSNGILSYDVKNFNGRLCLDFSKVLSAVCTHEYEGKFQTILFDERYTTKEAQLRLQMESIKASIDSMSAACLLERYLEDSGEGAIIAQPCDYPVPPSLDNFDYNTVRKHVKALYQDRPPRP